MTLLIGNFSMASDCPDGKTFNSNLNRCVLTQQSVKNRDNFNSCDDAQDKEACIKASASAKVKETEDKFHKDISASDLKSNNRKASNSDAAFAALSAYFAYAAKGFSGMTTSAKIFGATSAAGFIKNKFFEKDIEKKVKVMTETFEEEVSQDIGMKDAQVKAFDYLEQEQKLIQGHAKNQKSFYNIVSLGYLGAMGTAIYETYTSSASCISAKPEAGAESSPLSKINCPAVLIPIAGLAAANAYKLSQSAKEQASQAGENVEKIQDLKKKFIASIADYCPDGREEMSNPSCFCYLSDGEQNPDRSNSQICQNEWNKYQNLYVKTDPTQDTFSAAESAGCMFIDGKFDANCNCRKVKNKTTGQNACMKATLPDSSISALGGINTSPAISEINKTLEGQSQAGVLTPGIDALSAAANAKRDKVLEKVKGKLAEKGIRNPQKLALDHNMAMKRKFGGKLSNPLNSKMANSSLSSRKGVPESLKKALSNIEASSDFAAIKSPNRKKNTKTKNKNEWLDFNAANGSSSQKVLNFANNSHMDKKYKFDNNDINEDKGVSIFKVISNRYNTSGLRRLFADE